MLRMARCCRFLLLLCLYLRKEMMSLLGSVAIDPVYLLWFERPLVTLIDKAQLAVPYQNWLGLVNLMEHTSLKYIDLNVTNCPEFELLVAVRWCS